VVDSSGWIEYLRDGPNAATFAEPIESRREVLVPSIALTEVVRFALRETDEATALEVAAQLQQRTVVPLDRDVALEAARLGVVHHLPLADSVILATARLHDAEIWTQDADFDGLDDVRYVPA
jgi:predicted nucleic acid-binding protein